MVPRLHHRRVLIQAHPMQNPNAMPNAYAQAFSAESKAAESLASAQAALARAEAVVECAEDTLQAAEAATIQAADDATIEDTLEAAEGDAQDMPTLSNIQKRVQIGLPALKLASKLALARPRDAHAVTLYAAQASDITADDIEDTFTNADREAMAPWVTSIGDYLPSVQAARAERGRVLFDAHAGRVDAGTVEAFTDIAMENGVNVTEMGGVGAMRRLLNSGILPADVPDSIESGRLYFDWEDGGLVIDGEGL